MTVKELIEMLETCDENANVVIEQWDGDTFGIGEVNDYSSNIGVLTCLTGFEATVSSSCVKPENYDINIGKKYAIEKAKDQIWSGLGFVLQWAINGLKKK